MVQDMRGALSGIRVIEYADFVSGPYTGRQLAELGADVIKVESPVTGDSARRTGPYAHDFPAMDTSLLFSYLNGNKLGITLDVSCPSGRELLLKLIESADVFLFGYPTEVMDRYQLGYDFVKEINPQLIGTYVTPFGLTGPYRNYKTNEVIATHLSGLAFDTPGGVEDVLNKPPIKPGGRHGLMIAGLHGAMATMHALFARKATGSGQEVDVSELEPVTSFQFGSITRYAFTKEENQRGGMAGGPTYPALDGTVAMSPSQDHMWQALVQVLGNPSWANDPAFATRAGRTANREALQAKISDWTRGLPKEDIAQRLQAVRVPAFATNSIPDVLASPHLQARQFFEHIPLPSGEQALATGPRYHFSEGVPGITRPAPRLGEHTVSVLKTQLGLSNEDIVALFETGVI